MSPASAKASQRLHRWPFTLIRNFSPRDAPPTYRREIQLGIGTDIAALYGRGLLDVAIMNREVDEADGAKRNGNDPDEDTTVLYREGRASGPRYGA